MTTSQKLCIFPVCKAAANEDTVVITQKGADRINSASVERGDSIVVTAGTKVHPTCRLNYTNKKDIERYKHGHSSSAPAVKRSARVLAGPYDDRTDCLFCGNKVVKSKASVDYDDYSRVRTFDFGEKILSQCMLRNDDWAFKVRGRVEYFSADLHAAECVYHHSCDVNFRTFRDIPMRFRISPESNKKKKVGRPTNTDQEQAFQRVCAFFEDNDEEQLTVTDLTNKMKEYLHDSESSAYGNYYMKSKLLTHYGDSIFVSEGNGQHDIVTFREKTSKILHDYFKKSNSGDEEAEKKAIIETAAKLIKSDIKSLTKTDMNEYPKASELSLESTLQYLPKSLQYLLNLLVVGKDPKRKVASIGHSIVQAVRPRTVIAPLQLGLAVQVHQHIRSRFLVDILSTMGFCVSYSEVQRFEENAASSVTPDILGGQTDINDMMLLFAADNVDHNIITLDGKGTFHGMGMIAATTPGKQVSYTVPRKKISELNITSEAKVPIKEYRFTKYACRNIKFLPLPWQENEYRRIDLLWELSMRFEVQVPNWQGMMHTLNIERSHPGQSSVQFLPMIDMYPGDKTCILSTLEFICNLAAQQNVSPVVTFDQPLFWKASEIVNQAEENSPVKDVILLLGSFHTLMNLLGAIGTLMEGSGLKEILETFYGENAVAHIMSGKAVQRALRGHFLVDQCLINKIVAKVIKNIPGFESLIQELEELYCKVENSELEVDQVLGSDCMGKLHQAVTSETVTVSKQSKTSKLWLNYHWMLGVARKLIEADRTGSWMMHLQAVTECLPVFAAAGHSNYLKSAYLYLQRMNTLEFENNTVFEKFMHGFHVIRRSDKFWAGLGCDLVIEQTLMRSLKSTGGLTRGSGMTEHQRAVWTMSSPVSSAYSYAIQEFCKMKYSTSAQHKEVTAPRVSRDKEDLRNLVHVLDQYNPFSVEASLRNVVTGINADDDVNVHELISVGREIVKKMENQSIFTYSHKRNMKVKTLASAKAVKVTEERTIDPALLFQRFLVVSQTGDLSVGEVMQYELSAHPPSLFEAKHQLRKPDKPALLEAIRSHSSSKDNADIQSIPKTEHYVLDGGSLLHRLKWTEGSTYKSIADAYASFTVERYGKATVVFDGYCRPSTKDNTHERRKTSAVKRIVNITEATKFVGKKEDFLSNEINKKSMIDMITTCLRQQECHVIQAEGDADVDIVKAAVTMSSMKSTTLIGEDTDLLVLLLYHGKVDSRELYFRSDKEKPHVYDIRALKTSLGSDVCTSLLFAHAFTGCDTTSRIFGVGKKSVFQKVITNDGVFRSCSKLFCSPNTDHDSVGNAGSKAMLSLYNGTESDTLASLRYSYLCKKVAAAKTFVTPERLPPTASATKYHSWRTYYQVMTWMGSSENMEPSEWGWIHQEDSLVPIMMDINPAPDFLLKMIHCNCSGVCNTLRCSCKKYGLECTGICGPCQDGNCQNVFNVPILGDEDWL